MMRWQHIRISLVWGFCLAHLAVLSANAAETPKTDDFFAAPTRGFVSSKPAPHWDHALLTGNGTQGAMVMGNVAEEKIYLSHAALYLPEAQVDVSLNMAKHLEKIRQLCLDGNYKEASEFVEVLKKENRFQGTMDSFTGAFVLNITQSPPKEMSRYQRAVDFLSAEAQVAYASESGQLRRSVFVSRADDVIVLRIQGTAKQSAQLSLTAVPPVGPGEAKTLERRVKSTEQGIKDGYLHFRRTFETNQTNPIRGYEGIGKLIVKNGRCSETSAGLDQGLQVSDAEEMLLIIKIRPLLKAESQASNIPAMIKELEGLPADYKTLLSRHVKIHGELIERVSLSLDAPAADRAKPTEILNAEARKTAAPLAQIERAFDAGRYHIICATGYNPPNLQGLWCASVLAPWRGDFHMNADVQSAIAFLSMGNTPELMQPFFRFHQQHMNEFRQGMKDLYGMRGIFIPCAMTTRGRITHFTNRHPFPYWHGAAAWNCQFFYDYWQYTGDRKFLEEQAYPMLKETAEFYEDFLTVTDKNGHVVFVPSCSPEQGELDSTGARVNATSDVGAAKQVLTHAITAAKLLGRDADLVKKWQALLAKLPPYEVGEDGSFREWLWPGIKEDHNHRHAMNLYPLFDEMPAEIIENPALLQAARYSARMRTEYHEKKRWWAPGAIFAGLGAAHVMDADVTERIINYSVRDFWGTGMNSFCNKDGLFQLDASGSFSYLCASALVYSDPGLIRFFPARPASWKSGSLKGVRLRGAITLRELTWDGAKAKAVLVADKDQSVTILTPDGGKQECRLSGGKPHELILQNRIR